MKKKETWPINWLCLFFYKIAAGFALNLRMKIKIVIKATTVASPSETGMAYQAPLSPKMGGNSSKQGIRNKNWRVKLKKIDILAFPID